MEWWLELLVVLQGVVQEIDQVALEYSSECSCCLSWCFSFFKNRNSGWVGVLSLCRL